jgi:hypothetical protein
MPSKTEGIWAGEAIFSEANGNRSRDDAILISGQNLGSMRVLGRITASGKLTALAPAAGDGSQTAAAVLIYATDASTGDKKTSVLTRDCELNASALDWGALNAGQIATAKTQLATAGIIVREAI